MWEIELKAWVDVPAEDLRHTLMRMGARELRSYEKFDIYYRAGRTGNFEFRLRRDGNDTYLTYKDKSISQGLEVNLEQESQVASFDFAVEFFSKLGAEIRQEKHKTGWAYSFEDFLIELSHVEHLGLFIELEYLQPENSKQPSGTSAPTGTIAPSGAINRGQVPDTKTLRERMLAILSALSIPHSRIESRPYTAMLAQGTDQASQKKLR